MLAARAKRVAMPLADQRARLCRFRLLRKSLRRRLFLLRRPCPPRLSTAPAVEPVPDRGGLAHDPEKACPAVDTGWKPVFRLRLWYGPSFGLTLRQAKEGRILQYVLRTSNFKSNLAELEFTVTSSAKLCGRFILVSITAALIVTTASAQSRVAGEKITLDQMKLRPTSDRVVVKFREGQHIKIGQERIAGMRSSDLADFNRALAEVGISVNSIE
jgi:hypothetical protein